MRRRNNKAGRAEAKRQKRREALGMRGGGHSGAEAFDALSVFEAFQQSWRTEKASGAGAQARTDTSKDQTRKETVRDKHKVRKTGGEIRTGSSWIQDYFSEYETQSTCCILPKPVILSLSRYNSVVVFFSSSCIRLEHARELWNPTLTRALLYSSAINLTTVRVQGLNTTSNKSCFPQEIFVLPLHTSIIYK